MKKCKKSILLLVLGFVIFILTYIIGVAVSILIYGENDEKQRADVIIVLGAGTSDGEVSPVYRERINHGIWLYENDYAEYIIFTGGIGDGNEKSDALIAMEYAVSCDVPEENILIEERSVITEENLQYSKELMDERALKNAIIVSDPLHMKRAMLMASDYGITAYSSPTPSTMYKSLKTKLPFLAREEFFYIGYLVVRVFK